MPTTRKGFISGVAVTASLVAAASKVASAKPHPTLRGLTYTTLRTDKGDSLGIVTSYGIIDMVAVNAALNATAPTTIDDVLAGHGDTEALTRYATLPAGSLPKGCVKHASDVQFAPAVTRPQKILCVGINYRAHAAETGTQAPTVPELFNKYNTTLNRHGGTIPVSQTKATEFDYEAELVMIVGKEARNVPEASALDYVFGYTTGNDFTARDLQSRTSQWMLGKTPDLFAPLGPYIVGADLIPDPQTLTIECRVNGEVRQHAGTADMVHSCANILSYASQYITLHPGDIIFTGTPQGVIIGYPPDKRVWLKPGDKVETSISQIGTLDFTLT